MALDLYQILAVEPEADFELIKRQYRILVREHHPDIAADKEAAHERMQEILRAWSVLSDPAERARYDRTRRGATGTTPPATPSKPGTPGHMDSWATNIPSEAVRKARIAQNFKQARIPHHSSNPRTRLLTMVFEAAQTYYEGHMAEAIDICMKVMRSDPTNAEAPALLGDIYAEQGRKDVAVVMYERAMRNQPGNLLYRQKWQALKNGTPIRTPGHGARRGTTSAPSAAAGNGAQSGGPNANGAAPAEPVAEAGVPAPPPVAVANAPAGTDDAGRATLKHKLTGWMGRRK